MVHHNLHIGEKILDFSSLVEVYASDNLVRNVPSDALLLKKTGLGVCAVEDSKVFIEAVFAPDMADDFSCFSLHFIGPKLFALSAGILCDDRIGKI